MPLTGPEIDWLKKESGYTDEELTNFEAILGSAKFTTMLQKVVAGVTAANTARDEANKAKEDIENRYTNEFVPEMRRVVNDSIKAQGELAATRAQLEKAKEYGIVPDGDPKPNGTPEPPRAPGSPNPDAISRDDFGKFSSATSNTIISLQDLNAEHFKLFGAPLGGTQELVDEVQRQRTLGNKNYSLKQAWEAKHNVSAKREEIQKAEQQKVIDAAVAADRKAQAEKSGPNGNLRTGQLSRFSKYSPADASGGKEPWKASHSLNERNKPWREKAIAKVREFAAA